MCGGGSTEYVLICLFVQPPYQPKKSCFARYGPPAAAVPTSQCKQTRKSNRVSREVPRSPAQTRDERGVALPMDLACHGIFLPCRQVGCMFTDERRGQKALGVETRLWWRTRTTGLLGQCLRTTRPRREEPVAMCRQTCVIYCDEGVEGVQGVEGVKGVGGCNSSTRRARLTI